jgi:hypothetical protein
LIEKFFKLVHFHLRGLIFGTAAWKLREFEVLEFHVELNKNDVNKYTAS